MSGWDCGKKYELKQGLGVAERSEFERRVPGRSWEGRIFQLRAVVLPRVRGAKNDWMRCRNRALVRARPVPLGLGGADTRADPSGARAQPWRGARRLHRQKARDRCDAAAADRPLRRSLRGRPRGRRLGPCRNAGPLRPTACVRSATAPSRRANTPPETAALTVAPRAAPAAGARVGRGPRIGPRPTRGRDHDRLHHRPARHHPERSCRQRAQAGDQGRSHAGDRPPGCCHRPHQRGRCSPPRPDCSTAGSIPLLGASS